ncbi:MAG: PilZ domain-containing protein [Myxococcota bacterium]
MLVVYDGHELDDVYALLDELGARPVRARLSGPTRFRGWSRPPLLFVIPAAEALRIELPEAIALARSTRIAVADTSSEALLGRIARLGYDYLLRRPVHPDVVRLLLQRALYRGADARHDVRRPAGQRVGLRVGWRTLPATLVEFSAGGARVLVAADVAVRTDARLRLPRRLLGGRSASIACRVVRRRGDSAPGVVSLALRFDEAIEPRALANLSRVLAGRAVGPVLAPSASWIERWIERFRSWRGRAAHAPGSRREPAVAAIEEAPFEERRQLRRAALDREVVALDAEAHAAARVLVGRDLSLAGMRVDPEPDLRVGDALRIALYDPLGAPIELDARVVRDDGERGLALAFENLTSAAAGRLHGLVDELPDARSGAPTRAAGPGVERIDRAACERVVLGRVVEAPAAR